FSIALMPLGMDVLSSRIAIAEWSGNLFNTNGAVYEMINFDSAGKNYTTHLSDIITYSNSMRLFSGGTNLSGALSKSYQFFDSQKQVRSVNQVLILMTDAACNQIQKNINSIALQIKDKGIYLIVLAIDDAANCEQLKGENVASPGG